MKGCTAMDTDDAEKLPKFCVAGKLVTPRSSRPKAIDANCTVFAIAPVSGDTGARFHVSVLDPYRIDVLLRAYTAIAPVVESDCNGISAVIVSPMPISPDVPLVLAHPVVGVPGAERNNEPKIDRNRRFRCAAMWLGVSVDAVVVICVKVVPSNSNALFLPSQPYIFIPVAAPLKL